MISERRNPTTASLLFAKSGFSAVDRPVKADQSCGSKAGCLSCNVMKLTKYVTVNDFCVKLDFSLDCKSENCVYLAICRHCINNLGFYFGKTSTAVHIRFNGHRGCFKIDNFKYEQSALSEHVYREHIEHFPRG